jgi:hypothetical protein
MNGKARRNWIAFFVTFVATTAFGWIGPVHALGSESAPPVQYCRQIEFRITGLDERPVSDVALELDMKWGDLTLPGWYLTNEQGIALIVVNPVVENLAEGKHIRDRFLGYRTWLTYCLIKEGYVPHRGCIKDLQECLFLRPLIPGPQ